MPVSKLKGSMAGTACLLALGGLALVPAAPVPKPPSPEATPAVRPAEWLLVSAPRAGVVDEVALRPGARVARGKVLVVLDDSLAQTSLRTARARFDAALFDHQAVAKTEYEAHRRYVTILDQFARVVCCGSTDELEGAKLVWQLYASEAMVKARDLEARRQELRRAEMLVDMHKVRSPVNGTVKTVLKKRGEGVKNLEPLICVEPES
jgi:multidrug efflux pump subunit AcrA (membrane-fusion protein)